MPRQSVHNVLLIYSFAVQIFASEKTKKNAQALSGSICFDILNFAVHSQDAHALEIMFTSLKQRTLWSMYYFITYTSMWCKFVKVEASKQYHRSDSMFDLQPFWKQVQFIPSLAIISANSFPLCLGSGRAQLSKICELRLQVLVLNYIEVNKCFLHNDWHREVAGEMLFRWTWGAHRTGNNPRPPAKTYDLIGSSAVH